MKIEPDFLQQILCNYFEKITIDRVEPLGGKANFNYAVTLSTSRKIMLKIYRYADKKQILTEIANSKRLSHHGILLATPQTDLKGGHVFAVENKFGVIFDFIEGEHPIPSMETLPRIGALMAKLHAVPLDGINLPGYYMNLDKIKTSMPNLSMPDKETEKFFEEAIALSRQIPFAKLKQSVIHGDIFPDNLMQNSDEELVLLDFEELACDNRLLDIARATVGLCVQDKRVDLKLLSALLQGYESCSPLEPIEQKYLYEYIVYGGLLTTFWRFNEYYIKGNKRSNEQRDIYRQISLPVQKLIDAGKRLFYKNLNATCEVKFPLFQQQSIS